MTTRMQTRRLMARGRRATAAPALASIGGPLGEARYAEFAMEQFRRLYLSVQPIDGQRLIPAIGVTSARQQEGRSTIAAGVAAAMAADMERPVVLIEVDLTRPGLHTALGLEPTPGISEYLRGECTLAMALRPVADRLFVLPAGDARGEAGRLVRQLVAADLRGRLDTSGALLVLDLPPILDTSYGVISTGMADALLFVVRAGQTADEDVKSALARLEDATIKSLVLNQARVQIPHWVRSLAE